MRSRTARRTRAGLATPAPLVMVLILVAAAVGAGTASPALAATPSYTITTGATGAYNYGDDSPALPFIDQNGTFYFQSSHSLYGGSEGRSWDFYTGTDFDTNVSKAAISNSGTNADTTAFCNNSPTGLTSTYDPTSSQTSGFAERNYCDLIGMWVDPDTGNWIGLVHNEFTPSPFHDGMHYDALDYAVSTDHGATWTIKDHAITSPYSTLRGNDQDWVLASDGSVQLGTQCLDITGGGTAAGTAVGRYGCTGGTNQKWSYSGGALVNPASGLCLTAAATTTGSTFTIQTCGSSSSARQAVTVPSGGAKGHITLTGTSGECLDASSTLALNSCNNAAQDGRNQFPNQTYYFGEGDPRLYVDYASGYFYVYSTTQVLNTGGGGRADFGHVARCPIAAKMATGCWQKWSGGAWTQPGVGGQESALIPSDGTSPGYLDSYYDPANTGTVQQQTTAGTLPSAVPLAYMNIAYDAYLGKYIGYPEIQNAADGVAIHVYTTSDLATQKWVDMGAVATPSGASWYRWMVDSGSRTGNLVVGKTFRSYCVVSCTTSTYAEYVSTTIDTAAANLPTPAVSAGSSYQISAGDGEYLLQSGSTLTTTTTSSTSASQQWVFTPTGDGFFTIANASSGQNLGVVDTANSGRAWGAAVSVGTGSTVGSQWSIQTMVSSGSGASVPTGSYRLVNRYSGQALSLTSGTGAVATAPQRGWTNPGSSGDTHPVNAQTLSFVAPGSGNLNGTHTITTGGQALDDPASSTTAGTQLITYGLHGGANQQWVFTQQADGSYQIVNNYSKLCVDDSGSSTSAGTAIIQYTCTGNPNQRWAVTALAGGGYTIKSVASGLLVTTASTANSALVTQQADTGAALQHWTIT